MQKAIEDVGLTEASFLAEPVAAAAHYAAQARVRNGSTIAVYDLGGGTFDAAVVRKVDERSFELLGTPHGIDRLGGVDFDEAVFSHVTGSVSLPPVSPNDEDTVAAMIRLRRECTEAKEGLSADTEATIPVLLPDVHTRVRLVRAEFEDFIHDAVAETVDALRATIDSAGLAVGDVGAVLLVGGSSRIPLVAQLVSEQLERPVVVDADPKAAIALGAAVVASSRIERAPAEPKPTAPTQLARPVQTTPVTSVASRHRKIGVGAAGITAGIALVAGSAVAIVLRPESDSDRPNVVSAGDTVATTPTADADNGSTSQSANDLLETWSVPVVPDVDVLVPSLPPFGPPAEPAPSAEEAALTATIPVVGAFPPATDPSRPASSSAPTTRPSGSGGGSNSASSSAAGAPSGGAGSTDPSTSGSTSTDSPVPDPTTAPPATGTTPGGTTSNPPDTTPAPTVPPDTTPAPTDPPDTTPAPTDPPDTTPSPTDPPDTTPVATDPPADTASGSTSTDETQGADESAPPGTSDPP